MATRCGAAVHCRVFVIALLTAPPCAGWQVELKVNKMTSINSALSFNYYDLAFCRVRARSRCSAGDVHNVAARRCLTTGDLTLPGVPATACSQKAASRSLRRIWVST
jgi:hypothetical protein